MANLIGFDRFHFGRTCISLAFALLCALPATAQPVGPPVPRPPGFPGNPGGGIARSADQGGAAQGAEEQTAGTEVGPSGGITLNFVNADVRDVAKAVLGDYLHLNYEIAANTSGAVTIQTSKALERSQVLPALEQALNLAGLAMVHSNGIYEIMPLADARRQASTITPIKRVTTLGYGMQVAHIKYINAAALAKLLEPMAATEAAIRVDPTHNDLIIEGTAEQRQTLLDDISLFDTDWLAGMHFALFEPKFMDAEELASELNNLVGGPEATTSHGEGEAAGTGAGAIRLVPIDRLNAVLAIAPDEKSIDQLRGWVARLDRPAEGNDKKIYVYRVQNGRASDIASTLIQTLFGSSSSQSQQGQVSGSQRTQNSTSSSGNSSLGSTGSSGLGSSSNNLGSTGTSGSNFGNSNTGTSSTGTTGGANSTSRSVSPSVPFQPVTTPISGPGQGQYGRYETVGGVSRENISTVNITADETNNALVVLATPREYAVIQNALRQLDVAPLQVLLEAAIAEVTLTNNTAFGFQYFYKPNSTPNSQSTFTLTNGSTNLISAAAPLAASLPGFSYMFSNGNSLQAVLSALASITHVDVLSAPEVLVLNNETAKLDVGDQVPIVTATSTSTIDSNAPQVNSVQYLSTGVILTVTPRVNKGGMVMMDIDQQVSEPSLTTTSSISSPTISQREITSSVAVADGETIALGGLFSNQVTKSKSGIPLLQDIPYVGILFRDTTLNVSRDELMVLITPHVVESVQKARAVTDELRRKLPEVLPVFEQKG